MACAAVSALNCVELPAPDAEMLTPLPSPRLRFNINDVVPGSSTEMRDASVLMRAHK